MKSYLIYTVCILSAVAVVLSLCSCKSTENNTESQEPTQSITQIANPNKEMSTLKELNAAANTNIKICDFEGYSDSRYTLIDGDTKIAQYEITYKGVTYTARAAATDSDISGVYLSNGMLSDVTDKDGEIVSSEGYFFVRDNKDGVQYILVAAGGTKEDFKFVYDSMK